MKKMKSILWAAVAVLSLAACAGTEETMDASGSFEAEERVISAEATGKILRLNIEEGQALKAGETVGQIDVENLRLQAEQVSASMEALHKKANDAGPQVAVLEAQLAAHSRQMASLSKQLEVVDKEVARFKTLVASDAATQKQLDDLTGQKAVLEKQWSAAESQAEVIKAQIRAAKAGVQIQNTGILSEELPAQKRLELIEKQMLDGAVLNQYAGTVLAQYAREGEFTAIGKPLYKIADLSEIYLRAYITGDQLPQVKLGQEMKVLTDDGQGGYHETTGTISWISDRAEFTPKTIQTKAERANMVYALKVKVKNEEGRYKIGMYGGVKW
jgi:HlyD family secretion protein